MREQRVKIEERVVEILTLIDDENKIREGRKKAKENKSKYVGISSVGPSQDSLHQVGLMSVCV